MITKRILRSILNNRRLFFKLFVECLVQSVLIVNRRVWVNSLSLELWVLGLRVLATGSLLVIVVISKHYFCGIQTTLIHFVMITWGGWLLLVGAVENSIFVFKQFVNMNWLVLVTVRIYFYLVKVCSLVVIVVTAKGEAIEHG